MSRGSAPGPRWWHIPKPDHISPMPAISPKHGVGRKTRKEQALGYDLQMWAIHRQQTLAWDRSSFTQHITWACRPESWTIPWLMDIRGRIHGAVVLFSYASLQPSVTSHSTMVAATVASNGCGDWVGLHSWPVSATPCNDQLQEMGTFFNPM